MSGDNRGGSRFERLLTIAAFAALAMALMISEFARLRDGNAALKNVAALEENVALARSESRAALAAVIAPETVAAANASVYLIVVNGGARGTAFVIDRENGVLATAAHTANSLPIDESDAEVYLLNRQTRTPIPVSGRKLHAGFGAFRRLVESYQPVRKNSSIYSPQAARVRDLAFDAGLIFVDPIDPLTGGNTLGPDLPVADEEKLLSLAPGAPIAIIGYPYDTLDNGFTPDAAISRVERGVVAAMIAPLDNAAEVENPVVANLIIHRLSTAGGNSGSPVINADGEVIGIHTHGIESMSSNADGAAQRADVLYDLQSEEREQQRLDEIFLPAWAHTLSYWARAEDVLPWSFYKEYHDPDAKPTPRVGEIDFISPPPFSRKISTLTFGEEVEEWRASADDVANAKDSAFLIESAGEYTETVFTVDRARENVLFAFDYSMRSRTGACPITSYWRRRGEPRLQVQRSRASFELHLPIQGSQIEEFHVVFRRPPGCDPLSQAFIAGSIDWAPTDHPAEIALAVARAEAEVSADGPLGRFAHTARTSISRFFECSVGDEADRPEFCTPPEFIELETGAE